MRANSSKEHPPAPKEANNSPYKACLPNKEFVLEANSSKECMPPHWRESTANKSSPKEHSQVASSRSNTGSAPMQRTEVPTLVQDQGCGWGMVSAKVQHLLLLMLMSSLEEEGKWVNP